MELVALPKIGTAQAWREEARRLALAGVPAEGVIWRVGEGEGDLFAGKAALPAAASTQLTVPKEALESITTSLWHSDPERFARAYGVVLRLARGQLRWGDRSDRALGTLLRQEKAVRREIHKVHAFVRFREVTEPGANRRAFAAWIEPEHPVLEPSAPFFARRFGDMDWAIAAPGVAARFVAGDLELHECEGLRPPPDETEELWKTYYAHIFNPARLMVRAMQKEMPKKFWKNLPETALIPEMIRTAPERAWEMQQKMPTEPSAHSAAIARQRPAPAAPPAPEGVTLATLKPALDACTRCPLGACATQGVPGEGPAGARVMIVGEQPGDHEDLAGRPFVGPAGQVFDAAAKAAGLVRGAAYVTNAVKHFKFTPRGKLRLHQRPDGPEIAACRWWLDLERRAVRPGLIVALGATAAESLTGSGKGITSRRGRLERLSDGTALLVSLHPSYILRLPDKIAQTEARKALTADLARAARFQAGETSVLDGL